MSWINDVTQYSDSQHQKKNIFLTDAIFQAAGYAAMTQADSNQKNYVNEQNLRPVSYGSRTFTPSKLKMSIYTKQFLAIKLAYKEFGQMLWETPKPVII